MMSIGPLASPEYYFGTSMSSGEPFEYFEADKGLGVGVDPLLRHGIWLGNFAAKLGLPTGSVIDRKTFEAIYYGLDPKSGMPIRNDGKSIQAQRADALDRQILKQDFTVKSKAYSKAIARFKSIEATIEETDGEATREQAIALATARHEVAELKAATADADSAHSKACQKSQRPGTDIAFNAPKTVSMHWGALRTSGNIQEANDIESAHDRAVRETFEWMQTDFIMTRKRDPETSRRVFETVKGVIAAQWRHFDARPSEHSQGAKNAADDPLVPDPHLHDHINLFGPVEGADGEIYAAYTDYIRANIKALGAMYRARLAGNLRSIGYAIEREEQKNGIFFKLPGISKDQESAMSARSADIAKALAEGSSKRAAKVKSRMSKNTLTGDEVLSAWSKAFNQLGIDPVQVKATTLAQAIENRVDAKIRAEGMPEKAKRNLMLREQISSTPRARTNVEILGKLLSMEAHFSLADIRQALWEDAQFVFDTSVDMDKAVELRMREFLALPDLLKVYDPSDPKAVGQLDGLNRFGEPVFTSRKLRERENELFGKTVPSFTAAQGYGLGREEAMALISQIEDRLTEKNKIPFKLRDFQVRAVLQAACCDSQLSIQIAGAGLGKTTASQFTKEILEMNGRVIFGAAPSNKAAAGLGRELGIQASSIDKLLLDIESGQIKLDNKSVIFIDEAGMAGFDQMEKLLSHGKKSGAKLIFTGDPEQLPAVARGNVLRKLTEMDSLASNPDAMLYLGKELADWDYVSRQKQDWAKQASTFFSRGYVDEGLSEYDRRGFLKTAFTRDEMIEDIVDSYFKDPSESSQKLILGTTNDQVRRLNDAVRAQLKTKGSLSGAWTIDKTGMEISIGDRIAFEKKVSGKKAKLQDDIAKNEFATVIGVKRLADGSLDIECRLDSPDGSGKPKIAVFNTKAMSDLSHAFAATVHKSQGVTVDSVWAAPGAFISKELFYVMATRHRKNLYIHMLEHEKSTIMANAAKKIEKRHANDLHAVATMGPMEKDRLTKSSEQFSGLMSIEKTLFDENIAVRIKAIDDRLAVVAQRDNAWAATKVIASAARAITGVVLAAAQSAVKPRPISTEHISKIEQAAKLFGHVTVMDRKLVNWKSGREWVGRDKSFIYARQEDSGRIEAWPIEKQNDGMSKAAELSPVVADLIKARVEAATRKTETLIASARAAVLAWSGGPVEIDVDAQLGGKPAISVRVIRGAAQWANLVNTLKDAGGTWVDDIGAWHFPLGAATKLNKLASAGRDMGFAISVPKSAREIAAEKAWAAIESARSRVQSTTNSKSAATADLIIVSAAKLVKSSQDIFTAKDTVADGKYCDLFNRSMDGGTKTEVREFRGFVAHADKEWIHLARRDDTRVLAIHKSELPNGMWPQTIVQGQELSISFTTGGGAHSCMLVRTPDQIASQLAAEATRIATASTPTTAQPTPPKPSTPTWQFQLADDSTDKKLRDYLANVCAERDKSHIARKISSGEVPIEDLTASSHGALYMGMFVGVSSTHAYLLTTTNALVKINLQNQAFRDMSDEEACALVGWKHVIDARNNAATVLRLPEAHATEVSTTQFSGAPLTMTTLRADDRFVWLQASKTHGGGVIKLDRSEGPVQGISHRVWAAMAENQTEIVLSFGADGLLTKEPTNKRGDGLSSMHKLLEPKPNGSKPKFPPMGPDLDADLGPTRDR